MGELKRKKKKKTKNTTENLKDRKKDVSKSKVVPDDSYMPPRQGWCGRMRWAMRRKPLPRDAVANEVEPAARSH